MRAPSAAPKAFGPRAASNPSVVLLKPRYCSHSARPAASATMDPASIYDAMPARTPHFHCWAVTWLSSSCLFTSAPAVAMIQVTPPPARCFRSSSLSPSKRYFSCQPPFSYALHVHPQIFHSLPIRLTGVGRHDQAYFRDVGDDAETPLFELPPVNEQHGSLGLPDHGPLDLGLERVDVRELPIWRDPLDAYEGPV